MLQQRKSVESGGDGRWHSPDRDLAYAWPSLARAALDQLATTNWKDWFKGYFEYAGVTEEDIGLAAQAYAEFFRLVCSPEIETPRQAFERAGWFELKPGAQVALFMKMGQVATMGFFSAIRDVTPFNQAPPIDQRALYDSALRANFELTGQRRWVRWVCRQLAYLRRYVWPFRRGGNPAS